MTRTPLRRPRVVLLAALLSLPALAYDAGESVAPFQGEDETGAPRRFPEDTEGKLRVVVMWGSRCAASRSFGPLLAELERDKDERVAFLGVAPNAEETPEAVAAAKKAAGFTFPTIVKGAGAIAEAFKAKMTPTVYVIDDTGHLRYQGAIADKSRDGEAAYLADAVRAVLAGETPSPAKTRVTGFRITR